MSRPTPATPLAALAGWWLRTHCPGCRVLVDKPVDMLLARGVSGTVGDVAQRLRCRRCGGVSTYVVLADDVTGMRQVSGGELVEVRLV